MVLTSTLNHKTKQVMTQSEIKEIVRNNYLSNYSTEKLNVVAKVSSKFINKYQNQYWVNGDAVIDTAMEMYMLSTEGGWIHTNRSLYEIIENEKETFFKATY